MPTAAQRGMNARTGLECAMHYYDNRVPGEPSSNTAQPKDIKILAREFADWLDARTKERN